MAEFEGVEGEGSDSAARRSSWFDLRSSWRGLDLTLKVVYSMILSRISRPSARDLWRNDPPDAIDIIGGVLLERLIKVTKDSGIDRTGPDSTKHENINQATPTDSISFY
jgi:hypothetical protein